VGGPSTRYYVALALLHLQLRDMDRVDADVTAALQLDYQAGAQFTKYLTTILRLSYDNAKVTIDLRRTSNLQYPSYEARKAFLTYDSLAKL